MNKAYFSVVSALVCVLLLSAVTLFSCARTTTTRPKRTTQTEEESTEADTRNLDTDRRICIDPGHGFDDRGFLSMFIDDDEKSITLSFSSMLRDELMSRGYDVFMTHDGTALPLTSKDNGDNVFDPKERAEAVGDHAVDYFISVHCSTYVGDDSESVSGARVYYCADTNYSLESLVSACDLMCERIGNSFPDATKPRAIKTYASDGDSVIQLVEGCAVTLNLAFMSNERDAKNLINDAWNSRMVKAVANAVDDYFASR